LAAAEERQRLSRELHDAVNQTLWTASLTADSLLRDVEVGSELHRRLQRLRTLTSGAQAEMRTLLLELRPQELVEVDLHELLGHLVAAMECRKKLEVTVELEPVDLEPAARVALYRIAQEALTNITRHSAATVVSLTLRKRAEATSSGFVELRIVDNGRGFDVDNVSPGHLGLSIMGERAEAIGAELVLRAAPGHGTDLTVCLRG
jgi:signal transduction histidine kinase